MRLLYTFVCVCLLQVREGGVTLLQLSVWAAEPMRRLRLLVELVTACGSCRGGGLASCLYSFLNQGDPGLRYASGSDYYRYQSLSVVARRIKFLPGS